MRRVMIVGAPGSGKSTLARALGEKTGLPVHHMDHIHWKSGWIERERPEKIALATEVELGERWIFEGGMTATWSHRLSRADTLINLDFPIGLRAWRVLKRTLRYYGQTRPDLPEGCPEQINLEFWVFIWRTRHTSRVRRDTLMAEAAPGVDVFHLKRPADVRALLSSI